MKRYRFKNKELSIKSDNLQKMLEACVRLPELNRAAISEYADVSLPTSGKLLLALDECKITRPIYKYPDMGRPVKQHLINNTVASAVLDLSSHSPAMIVLRRDGNATFYKQYEYLPEASVMENISVILARSCADLKNADVCVSSLSVILSDEYLSSDFAIEALPTLQNKDTLNKMITRVFGTIPLLIMSFSQALYKAIRFNRFPKSVDNKGAVYLYVGKDIKICCLHPEGSPINCLAGELITSNGLTLSEELKGVSTPTDMAKVIAKAVNFAHCAFSKNNYIIEYDTIKFGSVALNEIKRMFAILSRQLPQITAKDHSSGLHLQGAAAAGMLKLLSIHITSSTAIPDQYNIT